MSKKEKRKAYLKGAFNRYVNDGIIAVINTEYGEALLDINVLWLPELKIGDKIEIDDADYYIRNGRVITTVPDEGSMIINETHFNVKYP